MCRLPSYLTSLCIVQSLPESSNSPFTHLISGVSTDLVVCSYISAVGFSGLLT